MYHQSAAVRRRSALASLGVLALLALGTGARAQEGTRITGHVVDAVEHAPIGSAAVLVTGTTIGQNTSDSGTFTFRVPSDAKTFTVRRIGYLAQTVPITAGKTDYTIELQKDILRLQTTVVTGVATTVASQNAANAVSVVSNEAVNQVPAPTIENSLEGKVPGAIIESNNGGAPGGGLQVQVRGVTSINGNAEPLYVVDGVVIDNETVNAGENAINRSGGGATSTGAAASGAPSREDNGTNRIADINPDDIESVEVLKGASASAIYGSKASAGVIVITTKKGTSGKARWSVNGQVGQYKIRNTYPARTFPTLGNAQAWYLNDVTHDTAAAAIAADNALIQSVYAGPGDHLQTPLFGNSQASYQGNVSVSGSSGPTQYFLSGLSKYDNGILLNTGYNKQSIRSNVTQQFASALNASINLNYIHDVTRRGISGNDNIGISPYNVFSYTPSLINMNRHNADGSWVANPFGPANPFADAMEIATPQEVSRFIGGGTINWTPFKTEHQSIQLAAVGGADLSSLHDLLYAPPDLQVEQVISTGLPGASVSNNATINYFNYQLSIIHHFTGLSNFDFTTSAGFVRERRDLANPVTIGYNLLAGVNAPTVGTVQNNFFYRTAQRDQSWYGQEQLLTLNSRLSVTAGITAERSTNDGDISKFYYYPHYAASYRIPQFVGFLDELKLRAAYGQSGNLGPYGAKYTPFNPGLIDGQNSILRPSQLGDPNLKPESEQEMEFGFDATLFKSRFAIGGTVYQKRLTNLLLQAGVAPSLGYTTHFENGGEFTNQGVELQFQGTPIQMRNSFTWVSTLTAYRNYSVVNALPVKNFNTGSTFGFGADYLAPGRSVTDLVNPGLIGANGLPVQIGDFAPGYFLSLGNEFTFKGFRVYGLLDWSRGGNTVNLTDLYFDTGPYLYADSAKSVNRLANWEAGGLPYVQTASFLKVREVTVSYTLPEKWFAGIAGGRISSARLSLSGYNLWAIYNYGGLDPEVTAFGNTPVARGVDVTPYAPARSYFLGLNLGL